MYASGHSWFGLPFHILHTLSRIRLSRVHRDTAKTHRYCSVAAVLPAAPLEKMCQSSTLQTTNEMAPACPLNPSGVRALRLAYRTVRPAFGDATPQLRPGRHSRRHRSGQPPFAPVSRGRNGGDVGRPSPVAPCIAEARAVDARFHARITLPPVSSFP